MTIDWDRFADRVKVKTPVRCPDVFTGGFVEGILLENRPFTMKERLDNDLPLEIVQRYQNVLRFQEIEGWKAEEGRESSVPAQMLEYLIDNTWLSFDQVMEG